MEKELSTKSIQYDKSARRSAKKVHTKLGVLKMSGKEVLSEKD